MRPLAKLLQNRLTEKELELVPRSYDVIGSDEKAVAVIELPEELGRKKKLVAQALMKLNGNVKTVLNKVSGRKGTYRLDEFKLMAGNKNTEVVHKEHGYLLKMDPEKVFFSPRESTERQRIASQVKPNELVCVFFSGVSPYPIAIAKKQLDVKKIYGIEINPVAHRYAQENVRINKLSHKIVLINRDVKKIAGNIKLKFDRIVMPMAVGSEKYLDDAFKIVRSCGIIHFYSTSKDDDLFSEAEKMIINVGEKNKKNIRIINKVKMLPFGVRSYKICLDVNAGVG